MPRPRAVIVCYSKWCFPPLKESGCRAESLLRCTRMSVKVVKRPPPSPPSPTPLYLSTAISHSRHFSPNVKHYHFWRSVFVTKIRDTIWPEISPHHHPQWPEFVSQHSEDGLPKDSKFYQMESQVRFPPFLREMRPLFIRPSLAVCRKLVLFSPDVGVDDDVDVDDNFNDDVDGDNDWCW